MEKSSATGDNPKTTQQTAPQQGPAAVVQGGSQQPQQVAPSNNKSTDTRGNGDLPMSLIKALRGKSSGENGSSSSNGGGSGNNSDNSALISLGNTSFGFNFDSEEGMNGSPQNSEEGDSDGNNGTASFQRGNTAKQSAAAQPQAAPNPKPVAAAGPTAGQASANANMRPVSVSSSHSDAAAAAVANLTSIASKYTNNDRTDLAPKQTTKRKAQESADNDSGGYNTDDESRTADGSKRASSPGPDEATSAGSGEKGNQKGGSRKKKKLDDFKREERNAREKERSFRISRQINELRDLLSSGGVIVPKGTKSSVLTEAANYIRMLQQHQYRSEIDRHQLVQQIQMIGSGALGQPAATAVRHVAAQNGVWSLGNFGGVPPKSAMMYHQPGTAVPGESGDAVAGAQQQQQGQDGAVLPSKIETNDYRYVFNSCSVGMAIASMGGAFIDCNRLFCQLSNYSKQEVCSMTIFNLTARQDLQHAFDLISQMLSAPPDPAGSNPGTACVLRGSLKNRNDLGLQVALIKGEDGVAKCFCVSLVLNPSSPFDTGQPVLATVEYLQPNTQEVDMQTAKQAEPGTLDSTPAYTTG